MPTFVVVKKARTMLNDQEGQKRLLPKKKIEKVHVAAMQDRQVKACKLAEMCKISKERIGYILHDELHMRKLLARWVLRLK